MALLVLLAMGARVLAACTTAAGTAAPIAAATAAPSKAGAAPLTLAGASTHYFLDGPADPVVELRVFVRNGGDTTDSTSIFWEPSFAERFTFLRSDPPPWRVRTDERGWGVLDTSGILPHQYGTFRVWFIANGYGVEEPRIMVVANGNYVVAEATAETPYLRPPAGVAAQRTFERGPVARAANTAGFLPADAHGAYTLATGVGLLLVLLALGGGAAAYRLATRPA